MQKTIAIVLALCLCIGLCACGAKNDNEDKTTSSMVASTTAPTIPSEPPENALRLDTYAKLVDYLSKKGSAETSNADINNPNAVVCYYDESTRSAGNYTFDLFLSVPYNGEEITFTLTKYGKFGIGGMNNTKMRFDDVVAVTYTPADGIFHIKWSREEMHDVYGEAVHYNTIAKGYISFLSAENYSVDMIYPDIESFSGYVPNRATIRQEIIDLVNVAINDMCLMISGYGISTHDLGFTNFVPAENPVIKPVLEHLNSACENIANKYPEYVYAAIHNSSQVYVIIKPDSLIANANDVDSNKIKNEFFADCLKIIEDENIAWEYQNYQDHTIDLIFNNYDDSSADKCGKSIAWFEVN